MNKMMQASRGIAIERVILTESSKLPKEELSDLLNPNQKIVYITVTNYVTRYVSLTLQEPTSLPSSQSKQVLPSSFTANQATLFTSPLMELPSPSSSPQSPTTIVSEIITPTTTNSHVQKFADSVVPVEYTTSNADLFTFSTPTSSTIDYISTSGTVTPTGTTTDTNTHLSITTDQNNPHTTLSENQLKSIIVGKKYSSTLTSSKVKATSIQATTTTNIKYNMARKKLTTRLKVTTACGNCQKRKIKCSGETPCSYCVKINKPCLPGKPGKKRGPPPGTEVNKNRKKFINTSFSQFNNSYHYQQRHVVNYSPDCGQDYDDININNNPRDCIIAPNSDENTENITKKIIVRNNNDIPLIKPIPIYPQSNTSTVIVNSCPNNSLLEEEKQSDEIEKDSSSIFKKSKSSTTNEKSPISGSNNRNIFMVFSSMNLKSLTVKDIALDKN
ncbi:12683_t:CDS:2 [Entrophospora sp. SA101]|nr:15845_t:CDS:2 [Entrophospora sp. SA101]CAJ0831499.1 12683_t:CDS:2 [Entrophospora sp. SA101]